MDMRLLHLVARRGNSTDFPENTPPALRSAISLGARFIEIKQAGHISNIEQPTIFNAAVRAFFD